MAYTRRYLLTRIKEVNEIYLRESAHGVSNEYIYAHHIRDRFHISRTTFYEYLTVPYERQLRELDQKEAQERAQNLTINFEDYDNRTDERQDCSTED